MCEVSSSICSSPIGRLTISYCSKGLHSLSQISTINDKTFKPDANQSIEILSSYGDESIAQPCLDWLETYFHSPDELSRTPNLCPNVFAKTNSFQAKVWRTLLENVHFGRTITYAQLGALAGNQKAARAVGTAMRRNPYQLIVPCHRVIRSNGIMGNYSGGERNNVKFWLLKHERNED